MVRNNPRGCLRDPRGGRRKTSVIFKGGPKPYGTFRRNAKNRGAGESENNPRSKTYYGGAVGVNHGMGKRLSHHVSF